MSRRAGPLPRELVRRVAARPWLVSFLLFAALEIVWLTATPLFGAPDEPSHVIRAAAVARGQLVGHSHPRAPGYFQFVHVPSSLVKAGNHPPADPRAYIPCFALVSNVLPSCFGELPARHGERTVPTDVGLDPPAYYAVVGLPSLVGAGSHPARTVYLMRLLSALLCAALLASAVMTLRDLRPLWVGASGLAFALTPAALFFGGVVSPNGFEICAGIAAWVSVAVLAHDADDHVDVKVLRRAGIAMIALVLARGLSPLWLALLLLTAVALTTSRGRRRLVASGAVRRWAAAVAGATVLAVVYILVEHPLTQLTGHGPLPLPSESVLAIARTSLGSMMQQYQQMIGVFGWLDTGSPSLTYLLWTAGLVLIVGGCLALVARRYAAVVVGLVALSVVVPVALDTSQARRVGIGWEGRWTLAFAVGVPIVAALSVAWDHRRALLNASRLPLILATIFVVAQFLAFGQYLRRVTVGAAGSLTFWLHPHWSPPLPAWLLLGGALVLLVALAAWLFQPGEWLTPSEPAIDAAAVE
ncbi:MAG TPA: DUF2142 domain-containing protein [Acidimicrobiia bacterium]|nr:DUF2142 domain-containing protein [Acidimicrobiia bacterium]